ARRRPHLDARAAALREELRERGRVSDSDRHDELRRYARRRAVVLEAERLEYGRDVLPLDVLEVEAVAVDQLAVAQRKDLDGRPVAVDRDPQHVDRADGTLVRRLPLREMADREETVA